MVGDRLGAPPSFNCPRAGGTGVTATQAMRARVGMPRRRGELERWGPQLPVTSSPCWATESAQRPWGVGESVKLEHDQPEAFLAWFMADTSTHLQTLKESLRSHNVDAEQWPHVSSELVTMLSTQLGAIRQQSRSGTARVTTLEDARPGDEVRRLLQQKQQILENEIGVRRVQQIAARKR